MNEQDVVSFFTGKGYEPHQAAGIAGNLMQESSLNPTAKNPTSGAFGFAQWLGPRKKAFMDFAMKAKKDIADPLAQLEFIDLELNTTERKAKDRLLASRDATEAAVNFSNHYERAGANEKKNATRASYANKILGAIIPSAQAGENMDRPLSYEEWVAAGEPESYSTLKTTAPKAPSEIPTRKAAQTKVKPLSYEEWVAAGEPATYADIKPLTWQETGEKFVSKVFPDTFKQAVEGVKAIPGAIANPLDTMAGIRQLQTGAVTALLPKEAQAAIDKTNEAMWNALPKKAQDALSYLGFNPLGGKQGREMAREFFKPYTSVEEFKQTLANNPGRIVMDISSVASGGANVAGNVGLTRTANVLGNVGTYTNPLTPVIAGTSAVAPVVGKLAAAPINYARKVLNPKNALLVEAAEGRGNEIVNALRAQNEIVPGSVPTAGQAAVPAGSTRYAALQAEVAEKAPTAYLERAAEQNRARLAPIENLAKTEADIELAKQARQGNASVNYGLSDPEVTTANATLTKLMQRPSMEEVVARAKKLAEEKGDTFQIGVNKPAQQAMVKDPLTMTTNLVTLPEKFAQYTGKDLHYLKLGLDDLIKNPAQTAIRGNELDAIKNTRTEFLNWVEDKIPAYKVARETFAAESQPIDKMKVGQFLRDKLKSTLDEDVLRPNVFATAVKEAPATLKKSTGDARFKKLTEIYSPDEVSEINSVISDMKRQFKFERQAKAGAKGGKFLPAAEIGTLPGLISVVVTTANAIIRRLQGRISEKVALDLAYEGLDLPKAAASLEKAIKSQQRMENIGKAFTTKGNQAKAIATAPQTLPALNALAVQQQNQNALAQ